MYGIPDKENIVDVIIFYLILQETWIRLYVLIKLKRFEFERKIRKPLLQKTVMASLIDFIEDSWWSFMLMDS